jgi:hypothetical protein
MANTTNYAWAKPVVNGSDNTWGTILNTALDDIDADLAALAATVTAANLLTSIKTVDGTGSGLDADKLDGIEANKFLQHAGAYTSGQVTVSTSSPTGGSDGDVWLVVA